jgi:hypothetical protein
MKPLRSIYARWLLPAWIVVFLATAAGATPTNEEISRSFSENMDQAPDYSRLIPWLFALAGIVAAVIYIRQRQKRQAVPKALNHPGKLMREIIRTGEINPVEMKKLSGRARELDCQNPLTLLLCPSLLSAGQPDAPINEEPDRSSP